MTYDKTIITYSLSRCHICYGIYIKSFKRGELIFCEKCMKNNKVICDICCEPINTQGCICSYVVFSVDSSTIFSICTKYKRLQKLHIPKRKEFDDLLVELFNEISYKVWVKEITNRRIIFDSGHVLKIVSRLHDHFSKQSFYYEKVDIYHLFDFLIESTNYIYGLLGNMRGFELKYLTHIDIPKEFMWNHLRTARNILLDDCECSVCFSEFKYNGGKNKKNIMFCPNCTNKICTDCYSKCMKKYSCCIICKVSIEYFPVSVCFSIDKIQDSKNGIIKIDQKGLINYCRHNIEYEYIK